MLRQIVVLLVGGLASMGAVSLSAQEVVLGQKYGQGVHCYFSGDYAQAYEQLSSAVAGGSKDPRVFYFRGLSYLKLGREQEATQDFKRGADLESRDVNRFYNVSKALERVQGAARVELERYRVEARMTVLQENERLRKARYEAIRREESRVVREQPPTEPEPVAAPAAAPAAESTAADPFTTSAAEEKPATAKESKAKAAVKAEKHPASDNPFDMAPAEKPTTEEKAPAEKPAAGKKGGVFGAMGKAIGKAMGGEEDAAAKDGARKEPPAEEKKEAAPAEKSDKAKKPEEKKVNPDDPFAT